MLQEARNFRFSCTVTLLIVILLILCAAEHTNGKQQSNFTLKVDFLHYSNPTSRIGTSNRHCCSVFGCEFDCENYFIFCLQSTNMSNVVTKDSSACPHGRFETGVVSGGDNIDFLEEITEDGVTIRSPFQFTFSSLNKSVQLLVAVRSDNFRMEGVLVEQFTVNFELSRSFSNVTTLEGDFGVGSITLGLETSCARSHFGDGCNVKCEGVNDTTGHYTCDSEGNVVCLPGFVDSSSKCITPSNELNSAGFSDTSRPQTSVVLGGVVAALLVVALVVIIVLISMLMMVLRWRRLTHGNKVCCRKSFDKEETFTTDKASITTVLGDNPTYGGDTAVTSHSITENDRTKRSLSVQPYYENTPSNSTASSGRREDHQKALTLTGSHSYDYITSRPITGYRLRQVQEREKDREDQLEESTGSSVTYYSIEYTKNRWTGAQESLASERRDSQPSNQTCGSKSKPNMGLPLHYETMETYNESLHKTLPSELAERREIDPRSHYEFDSES